MFDFISFINYVMHDQKSLTFHQAWPTTRTIDIIKFTKHSQSRTKISEKLSSTDGSREEWATPHQLGDLRERCELPSGVWGHMQLRRLEGFLAFCMSLSRVLNRFYVSQKKTRQVWQAIVSTSRD